MGKSDRHVFQLYHEVLGHVDTHIESVAFLGFDSETDFTRSIPAATRKYFDRKLKNWEINSKWDLGQKFDLIVCTRCAYFARDPWYLVNSCRDHLNPGGYALIDWGLGDHWRFTDYKVGWVRGDEHEYAYDPENLLHSCYWNKELSYDKEAERFWSAVKSNKSLVYGNETSLDDVVRREVPSLISYETEVVRTLFLWPEDPQFYIATLLKR